jgi:peptidylprolyl isomerase
VAFASVASGCGSSTNASGGSTAAESAKTGSQSGADGQAEPSSKVADRVSKPPHVSIPSGPPPKQLVVKDLKKGTGAVLRWGTELSARYIARDYKTGKVFDPHWADPFEWSYGPGQVVRAWVKGLRGMRVGGVRELIAPSRLSYKEGATVWVVELLSVS